MKNQIIAFIKISLAVVFCSCNNLGSSHTKETGYLAVEQAELLKTRPPLPGFTPPKTFVRLELSDYEMIQGVCEEADDESSGMGHTTMNKTRCYKVPTNQFEAAKGQIIKQLSSKGFVVNSYAPPTSGSLNMYRPKALPNEYFNMIFSPSQGTTYIRIDYSKNN